MFSGLIGPPSPPRVPPAARRHRPDIHPSRPVGKGGTGFLLFCHNISDVPFSGFPLFRLYAYRHCFIKPHQSALRNSHQEMSRFVLVIGSSGRSGCFRARENPPKYSRARGGGHLAASKCNCYHRGRCSPGAAVASLITRSLYIA